MIKPVVLDAVNKTNCKNFQVKKAMHKQFDLPEPKDLGSVSKDQFIKRGPTCGIDCCAI